MISLMTTAKGNDFFFQFIKKKYKSIFQGHFGANSIIYVIISSESKYFHLSESNFQQPIDKNELVLFRNETVS